MEKNILGIVTGVAGAAGGLVTGIFINKYHNLKNTPEAVTVRLEAAKADAKTAEANAKQAKSEAEASLAKLRATKREYQQEVHDEIEAKVRKELNDYIENAAATYAKATKEKEIAQARLELAKRIERDNGSNTLKYNF